MGMDYRRIIFPYSLLTSGKQNHTVSSCGLSLVLRRSGLPMRTQASTCLIGVQGSGFKFRVGSFLK